MHGLVGADTEVAGEIMRSQFDRPEKVGRSFLDSFLPE